MDIKKKAFIEAYIKSLGNITIATKACGISRNVYYDWIKADKDFKDAIESSEPDEQFLDFCENALKKKINDGDTTAIIFALKSKGRKRGWNERVDITSDDKPISFEPNVIKYSDLAAFLNKK